MRPLLGVCTALGALVASVAEGVPIGWASPAFFAAGPAIESVSGQAAEDAALLELERRLEASPDDLTTANAYRRAIIQAENFDRAIRFFGRLVVAHPEAANAFLNFGFAYVDKIPTAGSVTQVILANRALSHFSHSLKLRPSWVGFYTRGVSYLFWPKVFGRTRLGIDDLERALGLQRRGAKRPFHVRTYIALGDGYWKADDPSRASAVWEEGLREFPGTEALQQRLRADATALDGIIEQAFDPSRRVDTDLSPLWSAR